LRDHQLLVRRHDEDGNPASLFAAVALLLAIALPALRAKREEAPTTDGRAPVTLGLVNAYRS
jgi:hypothetical protein